MKGVLVGTITNTSSNFEPNIVVEKGVLVGTKTSTWSYGVNSQLIVCTCMSGGFVLGTSKRPSSETEPTIIIARVLIEKITTMGSDSETSYRRRGGSSSEFQVVGVQAEP